MRIAAAFVVVLLVAGAVVWLRRPIGKLAYEERASGSPASLRKETSVQTPADVRLLYAIDGRRVLVFVAGSSSLSCLARDRVRLDAGELWLEIEPGSGRFVVETPEGEARVVGTSFGVIVTPKGTAVDVASGRVEVEAGGVTQFVGADGRACVVSRGTPTVAVDGKVGRPAWAEEILASATLRAAALYYPSGDPRYKDPNAGRR